MFHIGQEVVCVDAKGNECLVEGAKYTITCVIPGMFVAKGPERFDNRTCAGLHLAEIGQEHGYVPFYASRFRPVIRRATDISIFTAMLNPKKVREDA